jgi:uncharacterized protein (DUF2236 family)
VVFGSEELAAGVGRRIRWVHEHVIGPRYRANDPANLLWVHATLAETALGCYERVVGPLSAGDRETYYEEMKLVAETFGCPISGQPVDLAAFTAYFEERVRAIDVTDVGRRLARDIVRPTLPGRLHLPLAPALALQRLLAVGLLPEPLRTGFGFEWNDMQQRRLDRVIAAARAVTKVTPRNARVAPVHLNGRYLLRLARRHVAEFDAKAASVSMRN